ncbi:MULTISPECIES: 3'(2'),5'-bisphosphate nucleotidase CysQ [Actinomadura]|uniref:inositol-phosphate phosphatase n=1 Tax=Actinomadura livida TaxID=79909 RepID=A0A7W7MWT4_9ACTN|nr:MULTISPECIES: 3'(2'),5'-bisphosphate nucleotidase CysQ [Actinomadura]MBB4773179.1 3'(2'), 5'-bisphosphate nucleotidase [Actinomadura catellatispora]TDB90665.1 3'(2'),5'-bisphosphate nucleotidase CysQ [Actinomadura sp. 7K534]GGU18571.1 3'-phosphoadenosine 5'-phosphate phosphatase [Actinomadura livida]
MTDNGAREGAADDHALAAELAGTAGRLLLGVRDELGFADARALKDTGDLRAHEYLMAALAERCPGDAVLSEEGRSSAAGKRSRGDDRAPTRNTADAERRTAERVWIIDPLDGTREFSEEGRRDWAVHVALWRRDPSGGGRLAAGAVALPAQGLTLRTDATGGASLVRTDPGEPDPVTAGSETARRTLPREVPLHAPAPDAGKLRIAVSRTRPPEFVRRLAEELELDVELVPIGSAGAKISAVLLGEVDAYVHAGGQYEWDSAAPAAVALAAGAHASRVDGAALEYNREDPRLPDILVCHPASASTLLAGIREVSGDLP